MTKLIMTKLVALTVLLVGLPTLGADTAARLASLEGSPAAAIV